MKLLGKFTHSFGNKAFIYMNSHYHYHMYSAKLCGLQRTELSINKMQLSGRNNYTVSEIITLYLK